MTFTGGAGTRICCTAPGAYIPGQFKATHASLLYNGECLSSPLASMASAKGDHLDALSQGAECLRRINRCNACSRVGLSYSYPHPEDLIRFREFHSMAPLSEAIKTEFKATLEDGAQLYECTADPQWTAGVYVPNYRCSTVIGLIVSKIRVTFGGLHINS